MKAILEFNLPDEEQEFQRAAQASNAYGALWDTTQEVFRPARKHGYPDSRIQSLIAHLDGLARAHAGVTEEDYTTDIQDATTLVGLLEDLFRGAMESNSVNMNLYS